MRDLLPKLLLAGLSRMPLGFNRLLGRFLGTLHWHCSRKTRHISLTNLELCFPEKDLQWRQRVAKAGAINMAMTLLETPVLWRMSTARLNGLCDNLDAFAPATQDQDLNVGLILATPHLGCWEYTGLMYASLYPVTYLYRPPKLPAIDHFMQQGRQSTGATLATTDAKGVKKLAGTLKAGGSIGLLPDQEANAGSGVFTPYFATEAYTMTLLPKMAQRRNSPVYMYFMQRTNSKPDYLLHALRLPDEIYDKDMSVACGALNAALEQLISISPEQYNWAYKRFNETPGIEAIYQQYKT